LSALKSSDGKPSHHHQPLKRAAIALLLAGVAVPAHAEGAAASGMQTQTDDHSPDIIVTATRLFHGLDAERSLDEEAIESYDVSTIDELIGEVQVELGDEDDLPLILVNGKRINSLEEIGALPVEALRSLQVLPRGSAVKIGGRSGQRVISLTLKPSVQSATLTAAPKIATDGHYSAARGEAILTKVKGNTRFNLALRARGDSSMLESDRGILQPQLNQSPLNRPYALGGNVIAASWPGEIDPLLSALAGQIVTAAPIPDVANPTLADFVPNANMPLVTNLGEYRTLRPRSRNYDLNATFSTPLAPWLRANATIRLARGTSAGLRGLPTALFTLAATNPASPFSKNVGLAVYGANPLHYSSRHDSGDANFTFDADLGAWQGNLNVRHSETKQVSLNQQSVPGTITLDDSVDPFTADLTSLIPIRTDRTTSHQLTNLANLVLNGPAGKLPAGPIQATVEGHLEWNHSRGESTGSILNNRDVRRSVQSIRGAVDVPLTSRASNFGAAVGDLDATAEYSRAHVSDAGDLNHYSLGVTWQPRPVLQLRAEIQQDEQPAPIEILGAPTVITSGVRVFDPLKDQTVDVTQTTGGNPDLKPQTTKIKRVNALVRLVPRLNLQLNAEYSDTDRKNFVSSLPQASIAVMAAFPDRYVRDSTGTLTAMDLRPVNFESDHEKRLHWGLSMNAKLNQAKTAAASVKDAPHGRAATSTYLQLTANHTVVFSDEIVIRSGLDPVDLLNGGAIGIASGRVRHQLDGTAAITNGGLGARVGVTWRGPSSLQSKINGVVDTLSFSPVFALNLRAFADMKKFLPDKHWAKGFRISLEVLNATNDRQRVRGSAGTPPLQYQPGYRDPIGRTIEIELRKVF
jgi:iron complex outermembrane recepter protein